MYRNDHIKMYKNNDVSYNNQVTYVEDYYMIMNYTVNSNLEIKSLLDLPKLKILAEELKLKINKSQLARELGVDRRLIDKYMNGYTKPKKRNRKSMLDDFYDIINDLLLNQNTQVFFYKRILWQYLKDNHGLTCSASHFRRWITQHPEFDAYFNGRTNRTVNNSIRNCSSNHQSIKRESNIGEEAQIDWKESMHFTLDNGKTIELNIFSIVFSYSRYSVNFISLTKKQGALFHYLDQAFESAGGVPKFLKTDNMKTVMDEARTEYSSGKVNNRFQQFAKDYGFVVKPCIAGKPWSKGKVEATMKLWDELYAYNGQLSYTQLNEKVQEINERHNCQVHCEIGKIPKLHIQKEKDFLSPLPHEKIRNQYRVAIRSVKIDSQSLFSYKGNKYSAPPEYIGKTVKLQIFDDYLHLYSNTKLITIHQISRSKYNYHEEHYQKIYENSFKDDSDEIKQLAKKNLNLIGGIYNE